VPERGGRGRVPKVVCFQETELDEGVVVIMLRLVNEIKSEIKKTTNGIKVFIFLSEITNVI
jgi:hypothetical protein